MCPDTYSYSLRTTYEHRYTHTKDSVVLCAVSIYSKQSHEMKWFKYRRWLWIHPYMTVSVDEITTLSVTLKHCLCASKPDCEWHTSGWSDTSLHCRFMVVYVSWNSLRDRERQSDSPAEWPRFEPDLFLFFPPISLSLSLSLSCHMVKVEPSGER